LLAVCLLPVLIFATAVEWVTETGAEERGYGEPEVERRAATRISSRALAIRMNSASRWDDPPRRLRLQPSRKSPCWSVAANLESWLAYLDFGSFSKPPCLVAFHEQNIVHIPRSPHRRQRQPAEPMHKISLLCSAVEPITASYPEHVHRRAGRQIPRSPTYI
jgi:hypothetical protein